MTQNQATNALKQPPRVSVIIATRNRRDYLKRLLDSLTKQIFRNFEIVIIDGGSTDGTDKLVEWYQSIHRIELLVRRELGVYSSWNLGWKVARGEIVVYLDDDVTTSPTWLGAIVDVFDSSNKIVGVSGPTIIPQDRIRTRDFVFFLSGRKLNPIMRLFEKIYKNIILEGRYLDVGRIFRSGIFSPGSNFSSSLLGSTTEVDYLEACNMAYKKFIIEDFGGFDDITFSQEWSEVELCLRIKRTGYKLIFSPKAIVNHLVSPTGGSARADAFERSKDFIYFYFRNVRPDTLDKALRFFLISFIWDMYWIYKFAKSKNVAWLKGIAGNIAGLPFAIRMLQKNSKNHITP